MTDWEKRIEAWEKEGRGEGRGPSWKPWITATEAPTGGRRHRPYSEKFGRELHLLSDGEYRVFLLAERAAWVREAREQVPIPRELSEAVAKGLGIPHPHYPGSHVATVMTFDLVAEGTKSGKHKKIVFDTKVIDSTQEKRSLEKLQIAKECARQMGHEYVLVLKDHIPQAVIRNLEWIRSGVPRSLEQTPYPDYWTDQCDSLYAHLDNRGCSRSSLNTECRRYSEGMDIPISHALRAAKILLYRRRLEVDVTLSKLHEQPMSKFRLTDMRDQQRRGAA